MPLPVPSLSPTRRQALLSFTAVLSSLFLPNAASAESPFLFGMDIDGRPVHTLGTGDAPNAAVINCIVAVFVATDCPVSNRYLPLLARLAQQYASRRVRFWLVYPNPGDTLPVVRKHLKQYPVAASLSQLIAPNPTFLAHSRVHVTPEAALFLYDWAFSETPVWHGRIDNRYLSFGTQRPAATQHDLANAIDAALAGRTPPAPAAPPVGCAIVPRA